MWLSVVAATGRSVGAVLDAHWGRHGRHLFRRHDYAIADAARGDALVQSLRSRLPGLAGTSLAGANITLADDFTYHDPVDGSTSLHQGVRLVMDDGSRIVYRLSGTGTSGATLRVYLEQYVPAPGTTVDGGATALARLGRTAAAFAAIADYAGTDQPSMVV
jgi:phosphoglucomutase